MKRTLQAMLIALVALMMPIGAWAAAATDITVTIDTGNEVTLKDADGDGSYDIGTADELYAFAAAVNGGNTAINGELTANIVVNENVLTADGKLNGDGSNFRVWTPIGNVNNKYTGTFDGAGFTVSGMYFNNSETNYVGLFGYVVGTVKNVGVLDSFLSGKFYVGGVVGVTNLGTVVTNCYNTGSISGISDVGGVVGRNIKATVTNCYNTGNISGNSNVGGVVGYNLSQSSEADSIVTGCYNTGTVSGNENVGGVVGYNSSNATVTNCYYDSTVYSGSAIGTNEGTSTNVRGKTAEDFENGTVCELVGFHRLNENCVCIACGAVAHSLDENCVCTVCGIVEHNFNSNGFCTVCETYQPATLNADGCYEITNAGQLFWFANHINTVDRTASAVLTADINLEDRPWTPIGTTAYPYSGHFDGQGHTVSGLSVTATFGTEEGQIDGSAGLFGNIKEAGIRNLAVDGTLNCTASADNGKGKGLVVGTMTDAILYNCRAAGTVSGSGIYTGGLVGAAFHSIIINCSSSADVNDESYNLGGLVGAMSAGYAIPLCLLNSYCTGDVTFAVANPTNQPYVGGLVGYMNDDAVNNWYSGTVTNNTRLSNGNSAAGNTGMLFGRIECTIADTDPDPSTESVKGTFTPVIAKNYYSGTAFDGIGDVEDGLDATGYTESYSSYADLQAKLNGNLGVVDEIIEGHRGYLSTTEWGHLIAPLGGEDVRAFHWGLDGTPFLCEHNSSYEGGFCTACGHFDLNATEVVLTDGALASFSVPSDMALETLTYTRILPNTEWNALYVPFEVEVTEALLADYDVAYANNMHAYDTDDNGEIDELEMEVIKIKQGTLHANHPYFIRARSEAARALTLTVEDVVLYATESVTMTCQSFYTTFTLTGIYSAMDADDFAALDGTHYAIATEGGWWRTEGLGAFRVYMTITEREGSPVKVSAEAMARVRIVTRGEENDGETTEIAPMTTDNGQQSTVIYDLAGRRVEQPTKGVYVVNGKKVVIND